MSSDVSARGIQFCNEVLLLLLGVHSNEVY